MNTESIKQYTSAQLANHTRLLMGQLTMASGDDVAILCDNFLSLHLSSHFEELLNAEPTVELFHNLAIEYRDAPNALARSKILRELHLTERRLHEK